jgi:Xaa-Pro aminopeptidase
LLELGLELYHKGLEVIGPGVPVRRVCDELEACAARHTLGKDFCAEGFGHGIGLDLFEGPGGLFNGSKAVLEPGMTVAYEPMVVVEGLGTGVVEDTILITDKGYEKFNNYRVKTWD